jgi:primosomal protein N' (replication factor Y)
MAQDARPGTGACGAGRAPALYARVVPDIPTRALSGAFDYAVPDPLAGPCRVGSTVLVTFSGRKAVGYVVALASEPSAGVDSARVRPVEQVLAEPAFDEVAADLAEWMSHEYAAPLPECLRLFLPPGQTIKTRRVAEGGPWELVSESAGPVDARWVSLTEEGRSFVPRRGASRQRALIGALSEGPVRMAELSALAGGMGQVAKALEERGVVRIEHRRRVRGGDASTLSSATSTRPQSYTAGQREAIGAIGEAARRGQGDVVLVDGVTGSGKTEVYIAAIEQVRARGKGAIVLVPEISLTPQTVGRFRSRFGDDVAILHSRLSTGERFDQWDMVRRGEAHVVVGARSALFAPLREVGLIVIDEEHESSYKQGSSPRYHAREVAAELARRRGAALVLGSATPSLESLRRCEQGGFRGAGWRRVEMPERPGSSTLPAVHVVDMTRELAEGNHSIFSRRLRDALLGTCERGEKAVLLLNRRGFANFMMCRACGCVPTCPHCSTSLTLHERTHELVCHTCGRTWPIRPMRGRAMRCPKCGSPYLAAFGVGTQRVEDELRMLLPDDVDVVRMDADATRAKGSHQRLLERFDAAPKAVLVGTQMIAKGLDFPEVTLVGVVNADTTLKLPDFRAAERTYDLLEQVSGRAGRGERAGQVIIQTYLAEHPAIQAVAAHDRATFLGPELKDREEASYPPFSRLGNAIVWGTDEQAVLAQAKALAERLRSSCAGLPGWEVLGPAPCVKAKAKDRFRYHVLVKAPLEADLGAALAAAAASLPSNMGSNMALDVDAYDLI